MLPRLTRWTLAGVTAYCVHRFGMVVAASWSFGRGRRPDPDDVFGFAVLYTVLVMAIIAAHEAGHRLMAKRLGVHASGPWFLPLPISWLAASGIPLPPFGTLGAYTKVAGCGPVQRWQIAFAGPVAGFVVAASCVAVGVFLSVPGRGGPSAYQPSLLASLTAGLTWHPVLFAGWFGVLLTAFNLLPLPGLDGWHLLTTYEHLSAGQKWATAGAALWLLACSV